MKKQLFTFFALIVIAFSGCKDSAKINADDAGEVITDYLQANPEYKTDRFNFGEMRFSSDSEMKELEKYKQLADEGYISLTIEKAKKKFLSRDSSYTYLIKLTDKASDLVLKQDDNKATVKVVTYELASEKPVNFNKVNDNHAKVTVTLKKINTPFAPFQRSDNANSTFITKTYRLKLDKEEGWKVVK
jgi:hypothetical protein